MVINLFLETFFTPFCPALSNEGVPALALGIISGELFSYFTVRAIVQNSDVLVLPEVDVVSPPP